MSRVWVAVLAVWALAIAVAKAVMGDMIQEEARTRLNRIPLTLIRLASAQVPRELRADLAAEWKAELEHVLSGTEGMPLTRLWRGIRYSVGLMLSAREITDGLTRGSGGGAWRLIRVAAGSAVAAIGTGAVVTGITLVTGDGLTIADFAGGTSMALVWVISGIVLASGKTSGPILGLTATLGCTANAVFYLQRGDTGHLVWAAVWFCFLLLLVAAKLWMISGDRQWRRYQELRAWHDAEYPDCNECFGPTPG